MTNETERLTHEILSLKEENETLSNLVEYALMMLKTRGLFNNGVRWNKSEKSLAVQMFNDDCPIEMIATIMGRSNVSISMKLEQLGFDVPDDSLTDAQRQHKADLAFLSSTGFHEQNTPQAKKAMNQLKQLREDLTN